MKASAWKIGLGFLITGIVAGAFSFGTADQAAPQEREFDPASDVRLEGWEPASDPEVYEKTGLFGYIDGGAEIFLQYGFEAAVVLRFTRQEAGPELAVEICRMESPADAFGIYSVKREGDERISELIEAENWVSPAQVSFVKDRYYVSLLGDQVTEQDLEAAAAEVAESVPGDWTDAPALLPAFEALPAAGQIEASRRYIRGNLAAINESPLFEDPMWGFAEGPTRAYSAKYAPANAKTVLVDFGGPHEDITARVDALFREYLEGVMRDGPGRQGAERRREPCSFSASRAAGRHSSWASPIPQPPAPASTRRSKTSLASRIPRLANFARAKKPLGLNKYPKREPHCRSGCSLRIFLTTSLKSVP